MRRHPVETVTSAGGVVLDEHPRGGDGAPSAARRVLLIAHRNAGGIVEWTFPKGGVEDGESDADAAVREVGEETGHGVLLGPLLGTVDYRFDVRHEDRRFHKYVHYFLMWWDRGPTWSPDGEAVAVEWVSLEVARVRLAHANERALLTGLERIERATS